MKGRGGPLWTHSKALSGHHIRVRVFREMSKFRKVDSSRLSLVRDPKCDRIFRIEPTSPTAGLPSVDFGHLVEVYQAQTGDQSGYRIERLRLESRSGLLEVLE